VSLSVRGPASLIGAGVVSLLTQDLQQVLPLRVLISTHWSYRVHGTRSVRDATLRPCLPVLTTCRLHRWRAAYQTGSTAANPPVHGRCRVGGQCVVEERCAIEMFGLSAPPISVTSSSVYVAYFVVDSPSLSWKFSKPRRRAPNVRLLLWLKLSAHSNGRFACRNCDDSLPFAAAVYRSPARHRSAALYLCTCSGPTMEASAPLEAQLLLW